MKEIQYYKFGVRINPTEDEAKSFEYRIQVIAESTIDRPILGQKLRVVMGEKAGAEVFFKGLLFTCCICPENFGLTYICQESPGPNAETWYLDSKSLQIVIPNNQELAAESRSNFS